MFRRACNQARAMRDGNKRARDIPETRVALDDEHALVRGAHAHDEMLVLGCEAFQMHMALEDGGSVRPDRCADEYMRQARVLNFADTREMLDHTPCCLDEERLARLLALPPVINGDVVVRYVFEEFLAISTGRTVGVLHAHFDVPERDDDVRECTWGLMVASLMTALAGVHYVDTGDDEDHSHLIMSAHSLVMDLGVVGSVHQSSDQQWLWCESPHQNRASP
jgi:hypothetical protein